MKKGTTMDYATGDRVKITVDADSVKAGTAGTVRQSAPLGNASWVLFDGTAYDMLVPNQYLEPA